MGSRDPSANDEMLSGRMDCWSWHVDAADAKKAIIIIISYIFTFTMYRPIISSKKKQCPPVHEAVRDIE